MRFILAFLMLAPISAPTLAFKPSEEYTCCKRSDIRGGQCARLELTSERCAEIDAAFRSARLDEADRQRRNEAAKRRGGAIHDAMVKDDVPKFRLLTADETNWATQDRIAVARDV